MTDRALNRSRHAVVTREQHRKSPPFKPNLLVLAEQAACNENAMYAAEVAARVSRLVCKPRDFLSLVAFCDYATTLFSHLPAGRVKLTTLRNLIATPWRLELPSNLFLNLSEIADSVLKQNRFDYTSKQIVVFTYGGNFEKATAEESSCIQKMNLLRNANVQVILIGIGLCQEDIQSLGEISNALTFLNWDDSESLQAHVYELCGLLRLGQTRAPKYLPAQERQTGPVERFRRDNH